MTTNPHPTGPNLRWVTTLGLLAASCSLLLVLAACDGGGGGGLGGASSIRGMVTSISGGGALFVPEPPRGRAAIALAWVSDVFVPTAHAAEEGVVVTVSGTDLEATTASDGFFILSGVPPGNRELVFERGPSSGSLDLEVPAYATIDLGDVRVSEGYAEPSKIEVEIREDEISADETSTDDEDSEDDDSEDAAEEDGEDGVSETQS